MNQLGPVFVGIAGHALTPDEITLLQHPLVGGVVLFARNIDTPEQVRALTTQLHGLRQPELIITVDQEGGRVQRLLNGFTRLPSMRQCGQLFEQNPALGLQVAHTLGWLLAAEVLSVGIDMSFAPVLDVDSGISEIIGERSVSESAIDVAVVMNALMSGMHAAGMPATGKHFPGHGGVRADSHLQLPVDERSWEEIMASDIQPFRYLIQHGLNAMMPAHVIYSAIDEQPAGFSSRWLQAVLRQQLGFKGVIISDDLGMQAAKFVGNLTARAECALNAGCDVVLICNELDELAQTLDDLKKRPYHDATHHILSLRGDTRITYSELQQSTAWKEAVAVVAQYFS
jgi:beta-N-acetylhexosaminidase